MVIIYTGIEDILNTNNLINNKLKEKIQNEILLININLSSELEALKMVEKLR